MIKNRGNRNIYVINSFKEKEPFSLNKIYNSAIRIGASKKLAKEVSEIISKEVYPEIKTYQIFKRIKEILIEKNPRLAIRFSLKEGMRRLGPTGFPFEKYIGEIFYRDGYEVELNKEIEGKCLRYEIDFLAEKENEVLIGECKFRNKPEEGLVHSNSILYHYARYLDLLSGNYFKKKIRKGFDIKTILVTNARFTGAAIEFANCKSINLLGWRYPPAEGLESIIDKKNLYPVTALPSFGSSLAKVFAKRKIMLIDDLLKIKPEKIAKEEGIEKKFISIAVNEAKSILANN